MKKRTNERKHRYGKRSVWTTILAYIVVFAVTYAMILPAVAVDKQTVETEPGIELLSETEADAQAAEIESVEPAAETADLSVEEESLVEEALVSDAAEEIAAPAEEAVEEAAAEEPKQEETTVVSSEEETQPAEQEDPQAEEEPQQKEETEDVSEEKAAEEETDAEETDAKDAEVKDAEQEKDASEQKKAEPVAMPAQTFEKTIGGFSADSPYSQIFVRVEAEEGTFPEGTTIKVEPVLDAGVIQKIVNAVDAKTDENVAVKTVQAVNITFFDAEGKEIEPAKKVRMTMSSGLVAAAEDPMVVHVTDEGRGEVLDVMPEETQEALGITLSEDEVIVEPDKFSVYALVETELTTQFISQNGYKYEITVTYGPEAEIPEGSELKVEEILPGSAKYDSYNDQAISELSSDTESTEIFDAAFENADSYEAHIVSLPEETGIGFARYFDISIIYNGKEIEPKAPVEVKIEYADPVELAEGEELQIVHFADDGIEVITPEINGNEIIFEQDSFSVTATVTTTVSTYSRYALLVEYEGTYYEVMHDGSLQAVTSTGTNTYTVSTAEQWQYNNNRLRVQRISGYEYIDPADPDGVSTTQRTLTRTRSGDGYLINGGGVYLGVTEDSEGNPVLTGGINSTQDASVFYFATLAASVSGLTVDHIDIGVTGSARVQVPLAYGTYYYANGTEAMTVQIGEHVNVTGVNASVPVTEADLMSATISAYTEDSSGNRSYDNSFIINQYTSSTGSGQSQDQVRVGGTFPIGTVNLSQRANRGNVEQYITSNNQIYYEVDVTKPVELTLQDSSGNTLYQEDVSGNLVPLRVTVNVTLTANFSYWDDKNECPGISYFGRNNDGTANLNGSNASGMDFVLGTSDDTDASLAAIEIIKMVVDENGHPISLNRDTEFSFDIYQNREGDVTAPTAWSGKYAGTISHDGYNQVVQGRKVTVGDSGIGLAYDYSVDQGLVYIQESTPPETITDADGNELVYQSTHITTEYAWRNDDGELHDNINQDDTLTAIPDVVGDYHSTTYEGELHNTFLEFYVYNVYAPNTTEVSVTKAWRNIAGTTTAPAGASVVFELYADGSTTGKTITLDGTVDTNGETAAWVATFEDLPIKNNSGTEIVYTVKETTGFAGYTVSYGTDSSGAARDAASNNGTITNTEEPTTANATKAWLNADGTTTAPSGASVIYTLYKNGTATNYTVTLDGTVDTAPSQTTTPAGYESEAWKATFVNLPQYTYAAGANPVQNTYTIAETGTYPGYTPSTTAPVASGATITNTQEPKTAEATKAWKNADGSTTAPDGATVEFTLYADGTATTYKVTLDGTAETAPTGTGGYESASWKATFVNLPKYKVVSGEAVEIVYTVAETKTYPGYTASTTDPVASGSTITNEQDPTEADATKEWKNADGSTTAPTGATVVFTLYKDGEATDYTVTLDGTADTEPTGTAGYESEGWTATFVNLPKYKVVNNAAVEIEYTIAETTTYPGYTPSTTEPVASGATIKNEQDPTEADATKEWKNADGSTTAPTGATVVFTLYKDGEATDYTVTLDGTADTEPTGTAGYESEGWKASFVNLPKYKVVEGEAVEIEYTIAETTTYPGYTPSTTDPVASGETITNEQGSTGIYATKEWKNADGTTTAPESGTVQFTLYADGTATEFVVTLDGTADTAPAGTGGYESEAWKASFVKLPQYKIVEGEAVAIVYTIAETKTYPGYTPSTTDPVGSGSTITNSQDPTTADATKEWENADGSTTAPQGGQVTYTLYSDGTATTYTVTLDGTADTAPTVTGGYESEAWTATFIKLPKYKVVEGEAVEIEYTIAETTTYPGYTPSTTDPVASGESIKNTQEPTEAEATKEWQNADGTTTPPEDATVVFTLYADGEETEYTVTLDGTADAIAPAGTGAYESEAWIATFVQLPKYKVVEGEAVEIEYTIAETTTYPGYTVDPEGQVASGETITNAQEPTETNAKKEWKNADGTTTPLEDATVVFTLYADGEATDYTVTLDGTADAVPTGTAGYESPAWTATFVNLPKSKIVDGEAVDIEYTVAETTTYPGYTPDTEEPVASGETITNEQEPTEADATKAWLNADGTTTPPEGATVVFTLLADGTATDYTVTLDGSPDEEVTGAGGYEIEAWKAQFVNLPMYKVVDGEAVEIEYTIEETTTYPGYTADPEGPVESGATITNKQEPTEADATKAWKNADGTTTPPEGATVVFTLYADGTATSYKVTLDGTADTTVPTGTGAYESEAWKASFINLPKYKVVEGEAVEIEYTIAETTMYPGYTADPEEPVASGETITNKQDDTEVNATKEWKNADGTTTAPEDATVVFTLYADGEETDYTVTLDGTADTAPEVTGGYESEAWKAEFVNLPKYQEDGTTEIEYTIAETEGFESYEMDPTDPVASGGKITNTQIVTLIEIKKIGDWTADNPLSGVQFKLFSDEKCETQILTDSTGAAIGTDGILTTGADGTVQIGKFIAGTYYLKEMATISGYNLLSDPIKFVINKDGTIEYSTGNTDFDSTTKAFYELEDGGYGIYINNPSGTELPMTGGSGTLPYTLGGLALIIAAAMLGFGMKRRERKFSE